ncbi:MAG: hypothetical protein F6J90_34820 [Moorea sp. SIOASIH]|uniref:hypothetical protein n=1 Tax=Moorena sp. SIOASIH TaxID=2607817 RepID=UPI0013B5CF14|nr:hypothetical protein [Moorena sp. SIOASIH]NEO41223.1 hypothetical protein [Moorena sp. SIOASIH]
MTTIIYMEFLIVIRYLGALLPLRIKFATGGTSGFFPYSLFPTPYSLLPLTQDFFPHLIKSSLYI